MAKKKVQKLNEKLFPLLNCLRTHKKHGIFFIKSQKEHYNEYIEISDLKLIYTIETS